MLHPPQSLDLELGFLGESMVVDIFRQGAQGVAAHLPFAAVGVEHPHPELPPVRRTNQHQPVGADAEVPVAHPPGQRARIVNLLSDGVDIYVIVAIGLHFGEL